MKVISKEIEIGTDALSGLEIVAAIFGFVCVWFYVRRSFWAWPTGLVQVALLIVVFREAKLYADMGLHVVYVALQIFGWWSWAKSRSLLAGTGDCSTSIQVRRLRMKALLFCLVATSVLTITLGSALRQWTDAAFPFVDAFIAAASLVAQYLLAKRFVENWLFWIIIDVVAVGLFAAKALYPTAILYGLFLIMSLIGWWSWEKSMKARNPCESD